MVKKRFLYIFIVIFINDYFNFICVACEAGSMEITVKSSVYTHCTDRDVSQLVNVQRKTAILYTAV